MPIDSIEQLSKAMFIILKNSGIQFLCLFGILFVSGMMLTMISRWTSNSFRQFRYPKFGLYVFGVIGIPIHEFCHALFAKIFFHEVRSIKWFDPNGKGGSYGTVIHYYDEKNLYHRIGLFFIGMGPVLLIPLILFAAYSWLVPNPTDLSLFSTKPELFARNFTLSFIKIQNWTSASFYFFLYFAVCLTSQMELSPDDFKIARGGILPFFIVFIFVNTLAYFFNFNLHFQLDSYINASLAFWLTCFMIAILISLVNLIFCFFVLSIFNRFLGHQNINPFRE